MKTNQNTKNWKTNTCECQGTRPNCLCQTPVRQTQEQQQEDEQLFNWAGQRLLPEKYWREGSDY